MGSGLQALWDVHLLSEPEISAERDRCVPSPGWSPARHLLTVDYCENSLNLDGLFGNGLTKCQSGPGRETDGSTSNPSRTLQ